MSTTISNLADMLISVAWQCGQRKIPVPHCQVHVWPQAWGDTSCGFGGIGGQAVTGALTVVLEEDCGRFHVFHSGQFAYTVENPTVEFREDMYGRSLRGRNQSRSHYSAKDDRTARRGRWGSDHSTNHLVDMWRDLSFVVSCDSFLTIGGRYRRGFDRGLTVGDRVASTRPFLDGNVG